MLSMPHPAASAAACRLDFVRTKLREEMERKSRVDITENEYKALQSKAELADVLNDSNKVLRQESEECAPPVRATCLPESRLLLRSLF
jgi:hypothetical protein